MNIRVMGWRWFLAYTFILLLLHHTAVFFLETISLKMAWFTLAKVLSSTLFTGIVLIILQLLFFSAKRAGSRLP